MTLVQSVYCAYGSLALFLSILHNIFLLYHVETFVSIYKIDQSAFWIGETIFLFWNSLNDPLFGWLSDKNYLLKGSTTSRTIIVNRIAALARNGPFLALSFLTFWYLWIPAGLQFILCLCLYDSFLTIVDLQHTALLADLAVSSRTRAKLNTFNSIFSCFGSSSVFLSYLFWDRNNPISFRVFCIFLAIISALGFKFSCHYLSAHFEKSYLPLTVKSSNEIGTDAEFTASQSLKSYIKQIRSHPNFLWFTAMNLIQVFNCHFNSNFFPLFLEVLLGGTLSPAFASLLLGVSFLIPHINNIYFMHLCQLYGAYRVVQGLFIIKFLLSFFMWMLGPDQLVILCIFIASNRIFTEGTCKLLNLIISDLVDEDMVLHHRPRAVSALIFGTSSLLSKPGQTIAPILGTWLLSWYSGQEVFTSQDNGMSLSLGRTEVIGTPIYKEACFWLLVTMPLMCAFLQLLTWTQFTLHGYKLRQIKHIRSSSESGQYNQLI